MKMNTIGMQRQHQSQKQQKLRQRLGGVEAAIRYAIYVMLFVLFNGIQYTHACYFPIEIQGEYVTQSTYLTENNDIKYSHINITDDAVPIWGHCYRRVGNNVILMSGDENTPCFRCFNLRLVTRNVLQVITADVDYLSKCYTNDIKVLASCPNEDSALQSIRPHTEITLYKTHNYIGDPIIKEHCPFSDRYRLTYNTDDGFEDKIECSSSDDSNSEASELDSCPSGSQMNLRFKGCSFEDHDIKFDCLGHWIGNDNQKYVALMNAKSTDTLGPQYRCAIYETNLATGDITLKFSNDSTCSNINRPAGDRRRVIQKKEATLREMLILHPMDVRSWPDVNFCRYPSWMHGEWQHLTIHPDKIVYKDHTSFKTYTMKCMKNPIPDRYLVLSRSQCGEETYQCIWITRRSHNVLEFQMGLASNKQSFSDDLCSKTHFSEERWITEARIDSSVMPFPCPTTGEYSGVIPDALGLCSRLASDCKSSETMYYDVSACEESEDIYEERIYQCLGEWVENDFHYIYTKRKDIGSFECFVGAKIGGEHSEKIFLKEGGENCDRLVNPFKYGMEMNKISHCNTLPPLEIPSFPTNLNPKHRPTIMESEDIPSAQFIPDEAETSRHKIHYSEEEENVIDNFLSKSRPSMKVKETERSHSSAAHLKANLFMISVLLILTLVKQI